MKTSKMKGPFALMGAIALGGVGVLERAARAARTVFGRRGKWERGKPMAPEEVTVTTTGQADAPRAKVRVVRDSYGTQYVLWEDGSLRRITPRFARHSGRKRRHDRTFKRDFEALLRVALIQQGKLPWARDRRA